MGDPVVFSGRKRSIWLLITFAVAGLVLFGVAANFRWNSEKEVHLDQKRKDVTIAMKWLFSGTMAPYFAAQSNGIFQEYGLDVELTEGGPGQPNSIRQVLLKNADFGITGAHELAVARAQDQPIISLAVIFKKSPVCLLTTTDHKISEPSNLVGKTVEMTTGDNAEFEYLAMLRKNGVDPSSVAQVPWQFSYQGLLSGSSNAIVSYENDQPITLKPEFEKAGKTISLLCPRDFGVTPYADVLFTSEDLILSDPELVGRVTESILRSWEWANTHVEETVRLFINAPQLSDRTLREDVQIAVLRKSLDFIRGRNDAVTSGAYITGIGIQDKDRWAETISLLERYGTFNKLPDVDSLFTNRWARQYEMTQK